MAELFRYRLDEAIAEVERELKLRRGAYARFVSIGQMSRLRADSQIARLEAARDFLNELRTMKGGSYEQTPGGSGSALAG